MLQRSLLVVFTLCSFSAALAQIRKQGHGVFKDSLDGASDFSNILMEINGFVPVPYIITEPAVGGFGGALGLVFIRKQPPLIDAVRSTVKIIPSRPTVTGVAVAYTLNDTWLVGAARSGTWRKFRTRYRIISAYANLILPFTAHRKEKKSTSMRGK